MKTHGKATFELTKPFPSQMVRVESRASVFFALCVLSGWALSSLLERKARHLWTMQQTTHGERIVQHTLQHGPRNGSVLLERGVVR